MPDSHIFRQRRDAGCSPSRGPDRRERAVAPPAAVATGSASRPLVAALIWMLAALVLAGCEGGSSSTSGAPASASARAAIATSAPAASLSGAPSGGTLAPKALPAGAPMKVGVTLHPYFSWTKNVVGDAPGVEVCAVLPGDVDVGNYQPRPQDIQRLGDLDAIVVNGLGHDDFIQDMIRASGNAKLSVVRPNEGTPTIRSVRGDAPNSHTFLSFGNAIQQTYAIERALSALRPDLAETFRANSAAYAKRLRTLKADFATKLAAAKVHRVVTVHDGYSYLCQELGIEVVGVVEPSHGLVPSAAELGEMVQLLEREKVEVVLTEESFPDKLLAVLKAAGPVRTYVVGHIATGEFTADKFEKEMRVNGDTLVRALVTEAK